MCIQKVDLISVTFDPETTGIRLLIVTHPSAAITLQPSKLRHLQFDRNTREWQDLDSENNVVGDCRRLFTFRRRLYDWWLQAAGAR